MPWAGPSRRRDARLGALVPDELAVDRTHGVLVHVARDVRGPLGATVADGRLGPRMRAT